MCFFKKKIEPETTKPTSTEKITLANLYNLLHAKYPQAQIFIGLEQPKLCHYDDVAMFLAQDETNKMGYVVGERTCVHFAFRLKGQFSVPGWSDLCLGICWTSDHALNLMVTEDKKILFIEPQNDTIKDSELVVRLIII
jgi:hypothetical protein